MDGNIVTIDGVSAETVHELVVRDGGATLRFVAYPGHQGKAPINNSHLVITPESFTVMPPVISPPATATCPTSTGSAMAASSTT